MTADPQLPASYPNSSCDLFAHEQSAAQGNHGEKSQCDCGVGNPCHLTDRATGGETVSATEAGNGHGHSWRPIPGERGRYSCATCPAQAWRDLVSGERRTYRDAPRLSPELTAQPRDPSGGWVPAIPGSDEQEAGR